jgi:hypothetical protein
MKKQLLVLGALITIGFSGANAQSLNLSNYNLTVNGNTNAALSSYVTLNNSTSADFPMMVERSLVNLVPGHLEFFCTSVFCYPPGTDATNTADTIEAGTSSQFYGDVIPNSIPGTSTINYKFFSLDDPTDSASITLNFAFTTVGLNDVKSSPVLSAPSPNPADGFTVFTYNVQENLVNDKLVVYNMLGSLVKSIDVPGSNGVLVITTADLRSGVYFVSYQQNNGKLNSTTKLVVSHR